jgi:hypothetical protein
MVPARDKKTCFHPDAPYGCSKVGRAHTLQREGILSQIVDDTRHVLKANALGRNLGAAEVSRTGWREASTFPGFCATHDSGLFGPIEREQFTGSPQQTFLVGYRALCHEVFAKGSAAAGLTKTRDLIDGGRSDDDQRDIQDQFDDQLEGVVLGYEDNAWYKEQADQVVRSGDYCQWGGAVFEITGPLSLASAGSATPSFDLSGNRIQDLGDFSRRVEPLMFGMVPGMQGSGRNFVVFSWPPACLGIEALVTSLASLQLAQIGDALARFMLAHVENTYFSADWWGALSVSQKSEAIRLSALMLPDDEKTILGEPKLVDWKVASMRVRLAGA